MIHQPRSTQLPARIAVTALVALAAMLAACAAPSEHINADRSWQQLSNDLRAGRWAEARTPLAERLQKNLRDGHLQFLYALTEEALAEGNDQSRLERAAVGYDTAARFAPGHYWALLQLGYLSLQRGEHAAAQTHFAEAALDQPRRWEAFYGLGVAAYYRQDLALLHLAAQRALRLAPDNREVLRLGTLALAARGEPGALDLARRAVLNDPAGEASHFLQRVADYVEAAPPEGIGLASEPPPELPAIDALAPTLNQVVVEVTILLNSTLDQASRGVNLFDGLRVLYGYSNALTRTVSSLGRESTRTITSQISSPQLDYSLNLFNDSGQYYSVVARPSITAHLGRESQFFAGRTLNVEVSGVNLGQLQPIDVGVQLKVTPEALDGDKVTFQIAAERSFLSQEQIGTFERSLTTFRQSVSATADLQFGQTLVLSALSEQVADKSVSKVPVAGEVPVLNWFTRRSTDLRRQESLLILVTPKLPLEFASPETPATRDRAVARLLEVWTQRVDPQADVNAILSRLQRSRWLRAPEAGDLRLRPPQAAAWRQEAVEEALMLAQR